MKKKSDSQPNPVYTSCVEIWLKEIHSGWSFGAIQGKKMKSIITKITQLCRYKGLEGTDEQVIQSFRNMCLRLPEWFKDKDLQVIDSKFNEIVTQIQSGPKKDNWNNLNSASRVFGKYANM